MYENKGFKNRLLFFIITLIVAVFILLYDYAQKMLLTKKNRNRNNVVFNIDYKRGNIFDVNGRELAVDIKVYDAYVWTPNLDGEKDYLTYARLLSKALHLDEDTLYKKLRASKGNYLVKKALTVEELKNISAYKSKLLYLSLEEYYSRIYPEKNLGSLFLGFTGAQNQGLEGIEYAYNSNLSPNNKVKNKRVVTGDSIYLTIDLNIQKYTDDVLQKMTEHYQPDNALVAVMKAKTGEILAYSGFPNYDLNNFSDYPKEVWRNTLTSKVYEPGSTFKIFSVAIAYQNGRINDNTSINTEGGYKVRGGGVINDYSYRGITNPEGVIKYSSNIGAAYLSDTVDEEFFYKSLKAFGFGATTGLSPGEEKGLLKNPINKNTWSSRTKATISFGQEVGVTAIQMLVASTVFANGGDRLKPFIVKKIVDNNGKVIQEFKREVAMKSVISPKVAKKILHHMVSSTQNGGTGRRVFIPGFKIAVKTGTAQVAEQKGYSEDRFLGSIIAFAPGDDPEYIIYIFMDYPKGDSTLGGITISPSARKIIKFLISYKNLSKDIRRVKQDLNFAVNLERLPELKSKVPSYLGLSSRTILDLYKRDDIKLDIKGSGYVRSQSPKPGTSFKPGMKITLNMS